MNILVSKENRLNIRVKPDFKDDLKRIADYHGLTVSSYVHSVLVKQIRQEKEAVPDAFRESPNPTKKSPSKSETVQKKPESTEPGVDDHIIVIKSPEDFKKFREEVNKSKPKKEE